MTTPMKSIRAKCLDCCLGSPKEVRLCEHEGCALHPYRFGKRPTKTAYSEATLAAMRDRATNLHSIQKT